MFDWNEARRELDFQLCAIRSLSEKPRDRRERKSTAENGKRLSRVLMCVHRAELALQLKVCRELRAEYPDMVDVAQTLIRFHASSLQEKLYAAFITELQHIER